jgi:hypothetical protein
MDLDNDGVISLSEWQGTESSFVMHDWNGDGILSGDEIDVAVGRWVPAIGYEVPTIGYQGNEGLGRFQYLDTDGSGWIEALEWPDTVTAFNRLDLNNDNRLSRDEFGGRMIDRGIRTLPMTGQTIGVPAWERWTDTGIDVYARDVVLFQANGTIRIGTDDDEIATPKGAHRGHQTFDVPMLDQRAGALIGRIGYGPPFLVGSSLSVLAPTVGRLYLGVNDGDYRDNVGYFEVMVTIQ